MKFTSIYLIYLYLVPVIGLIPKKQMATRNSGKITRNFKDSKDVDEKLFISNRHATTHKKWGVDNRCPAEYFYDQRIHMFGNIGISGAFHAALAPLSTKIIDDVAYNGIDIRQQVADELSKTVKNGRARVVDLCCGVGISTRALRNAFPEAEQVLGIDTSPQMVSMARFLTGHLRTVKPIAHWCLLALKHQGAKVNDAAMQCVKGTTEFLRANAEDTKLPEKSVDLVTVMYAFHEAPKKGRDRILEEARRLLQPGGVLAVIDISSDYEPSESMLAGEPYVLEYQKNIHGQLKSLKGFRPPEYKVLVPGHVGMWLLKRAYA